MTEYYVEYDRGKRSLFYDKRIAKKLIRDLHKQGRQAKLVVGHREEQLQVPSNLRVQPFRVGRLTA